MMTIRSNRMLRNSATRGGKEIFAIESRHLTASGKTIREIVIFDNHPASLRLLSASASPSRQSEFVYAVLAIVLVLAIGLGIFWPSL